MPTPDALQVAMDAGTACGGALRDAHDEWMHHDEDQSRAQYEAMLRYLDRAAKRAAKLPQLVADARAHVVAEAALYGHHFTEPRP